MASKPLKGMISQKDIGRFWKLNKLLDHSPHLNF